MVYHGKEDGVETWTSDEIDTADDAVKALLDAGCGREDIPVSVLFKGGGDEPTDVRVRSCRPPVKLIEGASYEVTLAAYKDDDDRGYIEVRPQFLVEAPEIKLPEVVEINKPRKQKLPYRFKGDRLVVDKTDTRKSKSWRFGKRRTKEQAIELALAYIEGS